MSALGYEPLIAGIDTLELGYCIDSYKLDEVWDILAEAKQRAQSKANEKETIVINFIGYDFIVHRSGTERANYVLSNDDLQVRILQDARSGMHFPELRIVFRSQFLWRNGYQDAIRKVEDWVCTWANVVSVKTSRVDITTDLWGLLPILTPDFKEVVTRSRRKRVYGNKNLDLVRYLEGMNISGYRFGTKDLSCRIYDKKLENIISHKTWFEDLWKLRGWQEGDPVTRVEFQVRRKLLKDMGINSSSDLIERIPDLWFYLTGEWFTVREIGSDTHRNRWLHHPFWLAAQSALTYFGEPIGITRTKQLQSGFNGLEGLFRGIYISLVAMAMQSIPGSDIAFGIKVVEAEMDYWLKDPQFELDVEQRKAKYGGMY